MGELLRLLAAGLIGGVLGPVILEEYRTWRRERSWKKPRKDLLRRMLSGELVYRTLDTLSRTTGTTPEDCRSLLIEIDARGGTMPDGREAWALISRAPLQQDFEPEVVRRNRAILEEEEEEEE